MKVPLKNLIGQKFGRLTVIERAENKGKYTAWKCRCDCGNEVIVSSNSLGRKKNFTRSCGCLKTGHTTHGMTRTKIYRVWAGMVQRCNNPNAENYARYGGIGITVCEQWLSFENFYTDISKLPHFGEEGYTLDRIDNSKGYEPSNIRFATAKEQVNNRRNNILVEYECEEITLKELSEKINIPYHILFKRWHKGDRGERLIRPIESRCSHKKN